MNAKVVALLCGTAAGFVMAWAGLTDPRVIREMLLLQGAHVFLLMGSAIIVAAVGAQLLRRAELRSVVTREPIAWTGESPAARHVVGSVIFGAGWSIAGTCPGPVAAMIGQGQLAGLVIASGIIAGVVLASAPPRRSAREPAANEMAGAAGL